MFKNRDQKDLLDVIPKKDEIWRHAKSGNDYLVLGSVYNVITDQIDVKYAPRYECDFSEFTRQLAGHPKAWMTRNEDGAPRFVKVGTLAEEIAAVEKMING